MEQLPNYTRYIRPSNWYLTGFLVPPDIGVPEKAKAEASDDLDETPANAGTAEESSDDGRPARRGYFPSSMGLSFLIDSGTKELAVTVRWGDYTPVSMDGNLVWRRTPRDGRTAVRIPETGAPEDWPVPDSNGLALRTVVRTVQPGTLGKDDEGSRSVSIFLLNRRKQDSNEPVQEDRLYVFQPEIEVRSERPLPSKPLTRPAKSNDWDEDVAELHYADTPKYATGHGVSADWDSVDGECHLVRTAWIGQASVEVTSTSFVTGVELWMRALGSLQSGAAAKSALIPLVGLYREWIEAERNRAGNRHGRHKETAEELLRLAQIAASRIERGIDVLASDADVLDAFRVANRSVAHALERRLEDCRSCLASISTFLH